MPLVRPEKIFNLRNLNPLSRSLIENFGKDKRTRRKAAWDKSVAASYNRADIVDEKACDDIIEYLAPTLEQHKGCSIIDVHPGACLFSRKLHEYLKPKWHLLMEPEERYVEPYIQPLLDQPGSTYCHTFLAGSHPSRYWESYRAIHEDPTLLPPRPALPEGDPKLRQLDPSLLVIGNLERSYNNTRAIDVASLVFHQMPYAALSNDLFQRSGLVRMLWWVPERVKANVLPRNPMLRSAFAHGIEMGVEAREVAGVTPVQELQDGGKFNRKRPAVYDRSGIDQVAQRMRDSGMSAPEGRKLLGIDYQKNAKFSESAHKSPFESKARTVAEFQDKIDKTRARLKLVSETKAVAQTGLFDTMEYPQGEAIIQLYTQTISLSTTRGPLFVDLALQVVNLEASYKDLEDESDDLATLDMLKSEILKLDAEVNDAALRFTADQLTAVTAINEEQIAFYMSPQHTPLDRRPFEPLELKTTDFFPHTNNLCLLDLMPNPRDLSAPDLANNKEGAKVCAEMLRQLYSAKSRSAIDALNSFAVNAGQDLVPMVPAMYDVRRGGRLNPRNVRVRMLTAEMVEGLVKGFFEWPFRPQTWELTSAADAGGSADGEIEADDGDAEAIAEQ